MWSFRVKRQPPVCFPFQLPAVPPFPSSGFELWTRMSLLWVRGDQYIPLAPFPIFLITRVNLISTASASGLCPIYLFLCGRVKARRPCVVAVMFQMFLGQSVFLGSLTCGLPWLCVFWKQCAPLFAILGGGRWRCQIIFLLFVWWAEHSLAP